MERELEELKLHETIPNVDCSPKKWFADPLVFHITKVEGGYLYHDRNKMAFVPLTITPVEKGKVEDE